MMRLAQIVDGVVVNVIVAEERPEWAEDWQDAGDAGPGWVLIDGQLVPPETATAVSLADLPAVSLAQIVTILIEDGLLTEAEGTAWMAGILPTAVSTLIDGLPSDQRVYARLRAARPTDVRATDPLILALAAGMQADEAAVIDWFGRAARLGTGV